MKNRKRLGEMMTESGLVSQELMNEALADQWQYGGRLGTILVDKCAIDEKTFLRVLSEQLKVPAYTFRGRTIRERVLQMVSKDLAWKYMAVPVETKVVNGRKVLVLAMANPTDAFAIGVIEKITGHHVEPVLAFDNTLRMILMEFYDTQYGRGDLTLRRNSEPEVCDLKKMKPGKVSEPEDVSAYLGAPDPATTDAGDRVKEDQIERAKGRKKAREEDADEIHSRLSIELQAMLQILVRKGMVKPDEYAKELRELQRRAVN